jgi:hypothetical protein
MGRLMNQSTFLPSPPPAYRETSAEALKRLKDSGRDLAVRERVRLAATYLAPCTREDLYEFFRSGPGAGLGPPKESTISSSINTLINNGYLRVVGKKPGRFGSPVEIIQPGVDERVKHRHPRRMEQPYLAGLQPAWRLRWDWTSFCVGLAAGTVASLVVFLLMR